MEYDNVHRNHRKPKALTGQTVRNVILIKKLQVASLTVLKHLLVAREEFYLKLNAIRYAPIKFEHYDVLKYATRYLYTTIILIELKRYIMQCEGFLALQLRLLQHVYINDVHLTSSCIQPMSLISLIYLPKCYIHV